MTKAEDIARYLQENPAFFDEYADMLAQISVPNPHGGNAIALSDRQVLALREKNRAIEEKLAELIQFGEENDAIGGKLHRMVLALLVAQDMAAVLATLGYNLREDFAVPHVAIRIWRHRGPDAGPADGTAERRAVSEELRRYVAELTHAYCGPSGNAEAASWFGEVASHVRSIALIPLRDSECFGALALGSEDVLRFYPEMGTLYLKRLGEIASAALSRNI